MSTDFTFWWIIFWEINSRESRGVILTKKTLEMLFEWPSCPRINAVFPHLLISSWPISSPISSSISSHSDTCIIRLLSTRKTEINLLLFCDTNAREPSLGNNAAAIVVVFRTRYVQSNWIWPFLRISKTCTTLYPSAVADSKKREESVRCPSICVEECIWLIVETR